MASRRQVHYSPLPTDDDTDYDSKDGRDPRFEYTPRSLERIPWKSIGLALFLLCMGLLLLFLSFFIFTGHMAGQKDQAYGLLAIGILTFIPGMPSLFL